MAKKTKTRKSKTASVEADSTYLLKLVLYVIIGSQWLRITSSSGEIPIPVGFIFGLLFSMHEHFKVDRKIEYAVLLMAMFIGFWLPMGIVIAV